MESGVSTVAYTNHSNQQMVATSSGNLVAKKSNGVVAKHIFERHESSSMYSDRALGEYACFQIVPDEVIEAGYKGVPVFRQSTGVFESVCTER
jgi:hypothetical protein